jgi:hypothetical protein
MQPTPNQVHVNRILTNVSVAYIQSHNNFIASQVFPVLPVEKQTDAYFIYTKNDWFRDEAQQRAPGTESAGSGYGLSTDSYSADVFAFHKDVDNQTLNNADAPLNMDRDATEFVTQRLLLRQEIQWASDYFKTGVWGSSVTPSNLWSDYTNSDPISDVETGKRTILANTGFMPNTLTVGYDVWIKLKNHPDLVQRIQYGGTPGSPAIVNQQTVAAVFGLDRILVAMAVKATNVEGETAAYSFVQGKHALLTFSPASPSLLTPSAGYTFMWKGVSEGLGETVGIKQIPMPWIDSVRFEGQVAFDNKVVATDLGYAFISTVS